MSDELRIAALDKLLETTVLLHQDAVMGLAKDGLTPSRATVVWHLRGHGPALQRDIAAAMKVSPRNVTGLVDALVETGFVTREPHPTDRRATLVTLTPLGTETVAKLEGQQAEFVDLLFGEMPPEELDSFVANLSRVVARLYELGLSQGQMVE